MKIPIVIPSSNIHRVGGDYDVFANRIVSSWSVNRMTNGTFPNAVDWLLSAPWSIGGGVASYNDTASNFLSGQNGNGTFYAGRNTRLIFTISNTILTGARFQIYDGAANILVAYANYSSGTHELLFVAPATVLVNGVQFRAITAGQAFDIDDIILQDQA